MMGTWHCKVQGFWDIALSHYIIPKDSKAIQCNNNTKQTIQNEDTSQYSSRRQIQSHMHTRSTTNSQIYADQTSSI